jgi:hypothetical protein
MGLKISVDGLMTVLQYEKNTRGLTTAHIHGESWIAAQKSDLKQILSWLVHFSIGSKRLKC